MRSSAKLITAITLLCANEAICDPYTPIHEAGRCSIRGSCGKKSLFGKPLPCPDNDLAEEPADDVRKQLVDLCGAKWSTGPVCCTGEQVSHMRVRQGAEC
jgi:Niemann-Pick C1 protein